MTPEGNSGNKPFAVLPLLLLSLMLVLGGAILLLKPQITGFATGPLGTNPDASLTLLLPEDGAVSKNQTPRLNWTSSTIPGLAYYLVEVDDSGTFDKINYTYNTTNNSILIPDIWPANKTWTWKAVAVDSSGNRNTSTSAFRYILDILAPNITAETRNPDVIFINTSVTVNATITDLSLNTVWISGNWTGSWQNITLAQPGPVYAFIIGSGNFSNGETIGYQWYANDSLNNATSGSLQSFSVANRDVPAAVSFLTPANNSLRSSDNIQFTWTGSTDPENDTITYFLEAGQDADFTAYDLIVANISQASYSTLFTNNTLTNGLRYVRVRAFDGYNYSAYSETLTFDIKRATLNITSPENSSQHNFGDTITLTLSETDSNNWINNVTITLAGKNFTNATFSSTWTLPVTLDMDPGVYNLTAYGYNTSVAVNTTVISEILIRNTSASSISINYVCANETYATNNTNITLQMKAALQTISNFSNITIQTPTSGIVNLSIDRLSRSRLAYTYYASFRINETGTFNITGTVVDAANNIQSLNSSFTSFANGSASKTINLTGTNVQAFYLRDVCTNERIMAGNNFSIYNGSHYSAEAATANPSLILNTVNFTNLSYVQNYTEVFTFNYTPLGKLHAAPSNKRSVLEFQAITNMTDYNNLSVSWDYSAISLVLEDESNLVLYTCQNLQSCSFTQQSATLDTAGNVISATLSQNGTIYLFAEDKTTLTQEVGIGAPTSQPPAPIPEPPIASLSLDAPEPLVVEPDQTLTTTISIKNDGKKTLADVGLAGISNSSEVSFSLSRRSYEKLVIGQQESFQLAITSLPLSKPGRYAIEIKGSAADPPAEDTVKIFIDVKEKDFRRRDVVIKEILFAADLFRENPECLELGEVLEAAESAADHGAYENATSLIQSAVAGCQTLITRTYTPYLPLLSKKRSPAALFTVEMAMIGILLTGMFFYYRRRLAE